MSVGGDRRAQIIGAGLMGGSVGLALRAEGWHVTGTDTDESRARRGVELDAFNAVGVDPDADLVFVCTPVMTVADLVKRALAEGRPDVIVTDLGSVKGPVMAAVDHPRFVGGHPMAGSEQEGIDGADGAIFQGRTWVLTPTPGTDPDAYTRLHSVVASMGANVISLDPDRHDLLVAMVSHVPHLTAASLMTMAAERAEEHSTLLRLAAGGFRDMTRIAAGHPAIWLDICTENQAAIVTTLESLIEALADMRTIVANADRAGLRKVLDRARKARINLPTGAPPPEQLAEVRIPIPDRPGFIAEVTTLAGQLDVNIYDIELSHSPEGDRGILVLTVSATATDLLRGGLIARGFRPSVSGLGER